MKNISEAFEVLQSNFNWAEIKDGRLIERDGLTELGCKVVANSDGIYTLLNIVRNGKQIWSWGGTSDAENKFIVREFELMKHNALVSKLASIDADNFAYLKRKGLI